MANLFRTPEGKLDRVYLRVCAVYKLFTEGKVNEERARELLIERRITADMIAFWRKYRTPQVEK